MQDSPGLDDWLYSAAASPVTAVKVEPAVIDSPAFALLSPPSSPCTFKSVQARPSRPSRYAIPSHRSKPSGLGSSKRTRPYSRQGRVHNTMSDSSYESWSPTGMKTSVSKTHSSSGGRQSSEGVRSYSLADAMLPHVCLFSSRDLANIAHLDSSLRNPGLQVVALLKDHIHHPRPCQVPALPGPWAIAKSRRTSIALERLIPKDRHHTRWILTLAFSGQRARLLRLNLHIPPFLSKAAVFHINHSLLHPVHLHPMYSIRSTLHPFITPQDPCPQILPPMNRLPTATQLSSRTHAPSCNALRCLRCLPLPLQIPQLQLL
jgi:hypothetical protein